MSHIIVTGGAGGIGGAVHEKLVSEVDSVSLFDNAFPERPLNWACENSGGTRIKCDVTSMSEVVGAVRLAEAEHGAVSGLVIAAGILRPYRPLEEIPRLCRGIGIVCRGYQRLSC